MDVMGNEVESVSLSENKYSIRSASGIYFIKVILVGGKETVVKYLINN